MRTDRVFQDYNVGKLVNTNLLSPNTDRKEQKLINV